MIIALFLLATVHINPDNEAPIGDPIPDFYIKNTGQYNGVPNEDLNIVPAIEKGLNGNDISISVFSTDCADPNENNGSEPKDPKNSREPPKPDTNEKQSHLLSIIGNKIDDHQCLGIAPKSTVKCYPIQQNQGQLPYYIALHMSDTKYSLTQLNAFPNNKMCTDGKIIVDTYDELKERLLSSNYVRGRSGLGWINVFAPQMCNGIGADPNYDALMQTRFTMNIAATTNKGDRAYYSPKSSNLLFNVPSTDTSIDYGDNVTVNPVHTCGIQNPSQPMATKMEAATAIATGALALILQTSKNITWRLLQLVIALSSTVNDADHPSWITNAANIKYSNIDGFGRLNVARAIELIPQIVPLGTEYEVQSTNTYDSHVIPSCRSAPLNFTHTIEKKVNFIESVNLIIDTFHENIGELTIEIESPSGTRVTVNEITNTESRGPGLKRFAFTARQFLGENANGDWKVYISAAGCIPTGRITKTKLRIFGTSKIVLFGKRTLEKSTTDITDQPIGSVIPQPISYTQYKQLPNNESIHLSIDNYSPRSTIDSSKNLTFRLTGIDSFADSPATLFFTTTDPDEVGSIAKGVINFEKTSQINGFNCYSPHNLAGKCNITYIVNIVYAPDIIFSARCGPFSIKPLNINIKQYEKIKKDEVITKPYSLNIEVDDADDEHVLTSIIDYDHKTVLQQSFEPNKGYVLFIIPESSNFTRGILTVQSLNTDHDPCSVFINAFIVDGSEITQEELNNFKFNMSSQCSKISGLVYQACVPPDTNPIITYTSQPPSQTEKPNKYSPTSKEESANEISEKKKQKQKIIISISVIFTVVVVLILVGVTLLVVKDHIKEKNEPEEYCSETVAPAATL
ncbi:P-domain proprotein convertase, putative [Trichomonas vaginalis G3]|uniref:p-domain proprotein convertase, putative n=1 Tax=Trichomonas vaginalis (strain ATCC PRA-98 / G3) TaxID=412133 RepID=A2F144_TRIV3|nr:proprotein convertase subtilisin/kexin-related family [Trichomonas vaginalis G3]EAY01395.1 P-domain proprotein convertase, putative [Trichomonas vaginalis G3]KAI5497455.1 proprotein convertase subtilisin/kexin-related family [Trichomonas vaginalis G3]|eukprot:XP_001330243.1 P-domain proprotein convertase [Trichomonas vaginalis G3]